ncbi:MAG TPA: tyrosine-protein phosphatase [Gaiellaceae bacterium]|nr:tyrosine-protein phosphatase [Gaiellaceae bacterium]
MLRWDGCVNVRDLGGLPLAGGGETAFGVCVRADSIRALSDDGWQALADYGVRLAVDLRSGPDAADDPPGKLPIDVVRIPVNGHEVPVVAEWPSMQEAYTGLLDRFGPEFAGAVTAIARAEEPAVIHCLAGRDRTGLVSALMLRLAGVELDAIAADHARSDDYLAPWWEPWYADAPDEEERERRVRVTRMPANAMADVLAEVDAREYVLAGGAASHDLDRLVARLRGEA